MAEVMVDEFGRPEPPHEGGEAATLLGFLDYERATLEWKCRGLSDEQLRLPLRPSPMTLGGLLKHLACVLVTITVIRVWLPGPGGWARPPACCRCQQVDRSRVGQMTDRHIAIGQADSGDQASPLTRREHDKNA